MAVIKTCLLLCLGTLLFVAARAGENGSVHEIESHSDWLAIKLKESESTGKLDISAEVGVRTMPTFMAFRDGLKVGEVFGANPPALVSPKRTAGSPSLALHEHMHVGSLHHCP